MIERREPRQKLILAHIEQLLEALRDAHGEDETYRSAAKAVKEFQRSIIKTGSEKKQPER